MNTEQEIPVIVTEHESVIAYVQKARLDMLASTELSPKDKLAALNGLSTTALHSLRLKQDDKNSQADRDTAISMANALGKISINPFFLNTSAELAVNQPIVPDIEILPDETSLIRANLTLADLA